MTRLEDWMCTERQRGGTYFLCHLHKFVISLPPRTLRCVCVWYGWTQITTAALTENFLWTTYFAYGIHVGLHAQKSFSAALRIIVLSSFPLSHSPCIFLFLFLYHSLSERSDLINFRATEKHEAIKCNKVLECECVQPYTCICIYIIPHYTHYRHRLKPTNRIILSLWIVGERTNEKNLSVFNSMVWFQTHMPYTHRATDIPTPRNETTKKNGIEKKNPISPDFPVM